MSEMTEAKWVGRAQGAAVIVVLVVAAQFWPGWQLDSSATKEATAAYRAGSTAAQTAACAALFKAQPNAEEKLVEINAASGSNAQVNLIPEALRTLPGEQRADYTVGRDCLKSLQTPT
jgi:hypothetical protein